MRANGHDFAASLVVLCHEHSWIFGPLTHLRSRLFLIPTGRKTSGERIRACFEVLRVGFNRMLSCQ
jgi:hypothetical protein